MFHGDGAQNLLRGFVADEGGEGITQGDAAWIEWRVHPFISAYLPPAWLRYALTVRLMTRASVTAPASRP